MAVSALSFGYLAISGKRFGIADFYNLFWFILEYNEGVILYQTLLKGILGELIIKNILSWLSRQYWPCVLVIWQEVEKKFGIADFYNLFLLILEYNEGVAL